MKTAIMCMICLIPLAVNAQTLKVVDTVGQVTPKAGSVLSANQFLTTKNGKASAYFSWQNISFFLKQNVSMALVETKDCENGGRKSIFVILSGQVIIKANKFINPCSSAVVLTNKGKVRLTGTGFVMTESDSKTVVGVFEGKVEMSNDFGIVPIAVGQYAIAKEGEPIMGPFTTDWGKVRESVPYKDRLKLRLPEGWAMDDWKVVSPIGETKACTLLPHRVIHCK
jgi:FecR protein